MSKSAPNKDLAIVSGFWLRPNQNDFSDSDKSKLSAFLKRVSNQKLVFFYSDLEVMDFIRHECFDHNIDLVGAHIATKNLPGQSWADDFVKRTKLYGVAQNLSTTLPNHLDKGWTQYWMHYMRHGEASYRQSLAEKLSKLVLTGQIALEISSFKSANFIWLDIDYHKWNPELDLIAQIEQSEPSEGLLHFCGHYRYFGQVLPVASFCLCADRWFWPEIIKIYQRQVERLDNFPYAYDEEVVLSLASFQHPQMFAEFGQDRERHMLIKTG